MNLYHFCRREYLPSILTHGLDQGDVPVTQLYALNAVWLTSRSTSHGHGLYAEKMAIRLKVDVQGLELVRWRDWSRRYLDPKWLRSLHTRADQSASWYMVFGTISPDRIIEIYATAERRTLDPATCREGPMLRGEMEVPVIPVTRDEVESGMFRR